MSTMTALVPSDVNINDVYSRKIGELLVNRATATLYLVWFDPDSSKKKIIPIRGEASYKLAQVLKHCNVLQNVEPTNPEITLTWFDTDIAYIDPNGEGKEKHTAYISIKVPTEDGSVKWVKILPITEANQVYLKAKKEGSSQPLTLMDLLNEHLDGMRVIPINNTGGGVIVFPGDTNKYHDDPTIIAEYEKFIKSSVRHGELSIQVNEDDNSQMIILNNNGINQVIANSMDRDTQVHLKYTVSVGKKPINFHDNSVWYQEASDNITPLSPTSNVLQNARRMYMYAVKENQPTLGLTWKAGSANTDNAISFAKNNKIATINPTTFVNNGEKLKEIQLAKTRDTVENGWAGFNQLRSSSLYIELDIIDPQNIASIVFTNTDYALPSAPGIHTLFELNAKGVNKEALVIKPNGYYNNARATPSTAITEFGNDWGEDPTKRGFTGKTLFFIIHVNDLGNGFISFGYVKDKKGGLDGDHVYIIGRPVTTTTGSVDYAGLGWVEVKNIDNISIFTETTTKSNSRVVANINPIKAIDLPKNVTAINNELIGQNAFEPVVLATNANSVFLNNGKTLHNLIPSGKIITTLRSYEETSNGHNAEPYELLVEHTRSASAVTSSNPEGDGYNLRLSLPDGNVVRVVGKYEGLIQDHFNSSVQVTNATTTDLIPTEDDPSYVYYNTNFIHNIADARTEKSVLVANPSIFVRNNNGSFSPKLTIPRTLTDHVYNKEGVSADGYVPLSTIITNLRNADDRIDSKHLVFNAWENLPPKEGYNDAWKTLSGFAKSNLSGAGFVSTLLSRLPDAGVFKTSVKDKATDTMSRLLDLPNNMKGEVIIEKDTYGQPNGSGHITVKAEDGNTYVAPIKQAADGSTTIGEYKVIPVRKVNTSGEINDSVTNLEVKKDLDVKNKLTTKELVTPKLTLDTTTSDSQNGISAKIVPTTPDGKNTINLIDFTSSNGERNLHLGERHPSDNPYNNLTLHSIQKPTWQNENGKTETLLTASDLEEYYKFKQALNSGLASVADLNQFNTPTYAGYYTYAHNGKTSLENKHFPQNTMAAGNFLLEVAVDVNKAGNYYADKVLIQRLTHYKDKGNDTFEVEFYSRVLTQIGTWKPWVKLPSATEVNNKLDLTKDNQIVTGTVTFEHLTANTPTLTNPSVFGNITTPGTNGENNVIMKIVPDPVNAGKTKLELGGDKVSEIALKLDQTNPNAKVKIGDKEVATNDQITDLSNRIDSKAPASDLEDLRTTIAQNSLSEEVKKTLVTNNKDSEVTSTIKLGKTADGTANGTLQVGDKVKDSANNSVTFGNNSKLKLPTYTTPASNEVEFDTKPVSDFNNNVRYDTLGTGEGVFTASANTSLSDTSRPASGTATGIQLKSKKNATNNKSKYYLRNIYGEATRGDYAEVLTSDNIITDTTNANPPANSIPSYSVVKALSEAVVSKNLGELTSTTSLSSNAERGSFIENLSTGQYVLNTNTIITGLGLDTTKISEKSILHVYDKYIDKSDNRKVRKLIATSANGSMTATGIAHPINGIVWTYTDLNTNNYYTKTAADEKLNAFTNKLNDFTSSMDYTNLNTETNVGVNRISKTIYVTPENNKKAIRFSSSVLPSGAVDRNIIITIKGATGYAYPVDIQVIVSITDSNKVETMAHNNVPGSTIVIQNLSYSTTTNVVNFTLRDKSGRNTKNTGLNVFSQLFGVGVADIKNFTFDIDYIN